MLRLTVAHQHWHQTPTWFCCPLMVVAFITFPNTTKTVKCSRKSTLPPPLGYSTRNCYALSCSFKCCQAYCGGVAVAYRPQKALAITLCEQDATACRLICTGLCPLMFWPCVCLSDELKSARVLNWLCLIESAFGWLRWLKLFSATKPGLVDFVHIALPCA